jgi:hypothetical protein
MATTFASPNAAQMVPVQKIARFIATGEDACLTAFAQRDVVILENFAPYLFAGPNPVASWAQGMRAHTSTLSGLRHRFGQAQDFSDDGQVAFFSLPTHWSGISNGQPFQEDGGWSFVIIRQGDAWKVRNYGWAVTRMTAE